jgi:beta-glucosidase
MLGEAEAAAKEADVALLFVGTNGDWESEGFDRTTIDLPRNQVDLIERVAAANPRTVVVLQTGGPVEMPWLGSVAAVVENWLPGQVDGGALAPLLYGDVNFSGKLPVTFPVAQEDGPLRTAAQYPGVNDSKGVPHATYSEGLKIGYRWYDAQKVRPLFPFGFGLSYTTFAYSGLRVVPTSTGVTVQATVRNTGSRSGAEVVQVYVSAPASAGEPPKALAGYTKLTLAPGQSRTVSIPISTRAFSVWSTARHAWSQVAGCWVVRAGGGSASLPLLGKVARAGGRC